MIERADTSHVVQVGGGGGGGCGINLIKFVPGGGGGRGGGPMVWGGPKKS
jgi:hypothetical protein